MYVQAKIPPSQKFRQLSFLLSECDCWHFFPVSFPFFLGMTGNKLSNVCWPGKKSRREKRNLARRIFGDPGFYKTAFPAGPLSHCQEVFESGFLTWDLA